MPAAVAGIFVQFFSAASYGSQIGIPISSSLTLDSNPNTWETVSVSGTIPIGTTWLMSQVYYSDASLLGIDGLSHPGYVDAADATIVPEPASVGLLVLARAKPGGRRSVGVPFGPFLAFGALVALFAGQVILGAYLHHLT